MRSTAGRSCVGATSILVTRLLLSTSAADIKSPTSLYLSVRRELALRVMEKHVGSDANPPPASGPDTPPAKAPSEVKNDVALEKSEVKADESKALAVVEKAPESIEKKPSGGSLDRDVALANLEKEKQLSFIRAWEDSEKSKVNNKAQKKLSDVIAWENSKKAAIEAKLKKIEEELEKKKAEYGEKMRNKVAEVHKQAEEKKAMIEARRGEEFLKAEEMSAKYRATGHVPKKVLGCFGG